MKKTRQKASDKKQIFGRNLQALDLASVRGGEGYLVDIKLKGIIDSIGR